MMDIISILSKPQLDTKRLAALNSENATEFRKKCQQWRVKASQHKIELIVKHHETLIASVSQVEQIGSQLKLLRHHLEESKSTLTTLKDFVIAEQQELEPEQANWADSAEDTTAGGEPDDVILSTSKSYLDAKIGLKHKEWQWIAQLPDDLDVCLYEKRFNEAVDLICRFRESCADLPDGSGRGAVGKSEPYLRMLCENVQAFIDGKMGSVVAGLAAQVRAAPHARAPAGTTHPVTLLLRLGFPSEACNAFLAHRGGLTRRLCADMLEGAAAQGPESCLAEFGQKVFRNVLETYRTFLLLFSRRSEPGGPAPEPGRSEGVVDFVLPRLLMWVRSSVRVFCEHLVRLSVPGYRPEGGLTGAALAIPLLPEEWRVLGANLKWVMRLGRRLEKDFLSVGFALANELRGPLEACVGAELARTHRLLQGRVQRESWALERLRVGRSADQRVMMASSSVHALYDRMQESVRNVRRVLSPNYASTEYIQHAVTSATIGALRRYVDMVVHAAGAFELVLAKGGRGGSPAKGKAVQTEDFELVARRLVTQGKMTYPAVVAAMTERCKRELGVKEKRVLTVLCSPSFTFAQSLAQIANVVCVGSDLVLRVQSTFEKVLRGRLFMFDEFRESLLNLDSLNPGVVRTLCKTLARRTAYDFVNSDPYKSTKDPKVKNNLLRERIDQIVNESSQVLSMEHAELLGGLFQNYLSVA